MTPEVTPEITPEVTAVPTADLYIEMITPAGHEARIERTISAGEGSIVVMLALLLASLWAMWLSQQAREWTRKGDYGADRAGDVG